MMNLNMNMDTVINKLRNTVTSVTSTVSQLSAVLPGNPVTREYEVTQHIASGGPGSLWKIYSGYKKSTKQEAAVFVLEKKQLDKWSRKDRDNMIEILKKGVNQLTRLKHPRVLTVQHPLEESRDSLAFATEPVFASLANVLGDFTNMPEEEGGVDGSIKQYKLQGIEIKYGLLQICEGITFLNNDAKIIHGNLCPESVIITKQNSWKICGLEFCLTAAVNGTEIIWPSKSYDNDAHHVTQPCLDYLAPEITTSMSCSPASDMFSLGMLTFTSFNGGKPLFANRGDWNRHRQNIIVYNQIPDSKLVDIPSELTSFVRKLLNFNATDRPDSHEFSKFEFFHDEGVNTLRYLDSLFQWDNLQKSKFYKGLAEILPGLPHRVRLLRVIPCLSQEFVNPSMVPFVLPNVLRIAEWSTNEEYVAHVLPYLRDVMKLREPVQVLFIFMKYMELLLQKTPPDITKSDVLPLIYGSLESDSPQVQELCLSIIPSFAGLIDYPAMKNSLLPRIKKLIIATNSLSVRVNCLVCLGKILDHLDKWMVIDYILPFLTEVPSRDPAVIMGIIGIYRLAVNHRKLGVTKEIIATRILPFIFPLTIENGLTTQQFQTIMNFIYEMIKTVEVEHKSKLEELGAIAKERDEMKAEMNNHPVFNNVTTPGSDIFDNLGMTASSPILNSSPKLASIPTRSASMTTSSSNTAPILPSGSMKNNFTSPIMNDTSGQRSLGFKQQQSPRTSSSQARSEMMSLTSNLNLALNLSQMSNNNNSVSSSSTPFVTPNQSMGMMMSSSSSIPSGLGSNTASNGSIPPMLMSRSRTMGMTDLHQPTQPPKPLTPIPSVASISPMQSVGQLQSQNQQQQQQTLPQFQPHQPSMQNMSGYGDFQRITQIAPYPFAYASNPPPGSTNPAANNTTSMLSGVMQPTTSSLPQRNNNNNSNAMKLLSKRDIDDLLK